MIQPITAALKSPYFEGRRLPLGDLAAGDFEKFVAACFSCIEDALGIEIQGMPSGSGDGGFDISGKDILTGRVVCIQCKRQKSKLGIAQVAKEVAKVAANSKLEGSDVGQHRFLCTGGITNDLVSLLRGNFHAALAIDAGHRLATASEGELKTLRTSLIDRGEDPQAVVNSYVDGLTRLLAWDQDGFDVALSSRWTNVLEVVEKYFSVANVVREHPRAHFDRHSYVQTFSNFNAFLRPRLTTARLPFGMTSSSSPNVNNSSAGDQQFSDVSELATLNEGKLIVLTGDGGIGKTTVLELIRAEVLRAHQDSAIAVVIPLANYTPGNLDKLVQDELGVDFGSWRTLPDRVMLLLDGLNECPSMFVANLLGELKIILRRYLAACIVSTREAIRHRNIKLPVTPFACLRIEHLTPISVRRIAESRFTSSEAKSFEIAYLELANRAHAPHLWTPFSLEVALEHWNMCASLPPTLGEMIDKLMQSRCENEASSPSLLLGSSVVLALAGALAFVNLIANNRLECAEIDAGKWIRDAKVICSDVLGINDMPEVEVVELLKRHELLRLSTSGSYSFGHQLIVGALASKNLAHNWTAYLSSTEEPLADDAWIFAARLIPEAEIPEFLEAMFNVDLILGARTARELSSQHQNIAEQYLLRCLESSSPESVQIKGLFALAVLATPNAIARIKQVTLDPNRDNSYRAKQALAITGDKKLLRALVPSIEIMKAGPAKMSGGDLDIWARAPYSARLEVAREWLEKCPPGRTVIESLSLIAFEQDQNDVPLIERQFVTAMNVSQWSYAIFAMQKLDRVRARAIFEKELMSSENPLVRAKLFQIAAHVGIPFDLQQAFECALTDLPGDPPDIQIQHELNQLIHNVIVRADLPPPLIATVELKLKEKSNDSITERLWMIASSFLSQSIVESAEARLAAWSDDLGFVCNYFIQQRLLGDDRKRRLVEICELELRRQEYWHTWHIYRALALVGDLGFTPKIASILESMVEQIVRIRIAFENREIFSLSAGDMGVMATVKTEHFKIHLNRLAAALISPVAMAKRYISSDLKLEFLQFDMSFSGGVSTDYREFLLDLSNESIDVVLSKIEADSTRLYSLCIACECAVTETRIKLLACELSKYVESPSNLNMISQAIDSCWSDSICQMIMDEVANVQEWGNTQFFWDFFETVSNHLDPSHGKYIDSALLLAKTQFSRKILELWRDKAMRLRIGIGRLATEK